MLKILTNIRDGKGTEGDIELLEEISEVTKAASLCALGKTASDPLLSTLRYFRDEYEANIENKHRKDESPGKGVKIITESKKDE